MKKNITSILSIAIILFTIYIISCDIQDNSINHNNSINTNKLTDDDECPVHGDHVCIDLPAPYYGDCDCDHFCLRCEGDTPPYGTPGTIILSGYDCDSITWGCQYNQNYGASHSLGRIFPWGTYNISMVFDDSNGRMWTGYNQYVLSDPVPEPLVITLQIYFYRP